MTKTQKRLRWEYNKHEALKIMLELSEPEIWYDHAIYTLKYNLMIKPRTARKLFNYWQKRWKFKVNSVWDSSIRGLWAMRPMISAPLLRLSGMESKIELDDGESFRFSFPVQLTEF